MAEARHRERVGPDASARPDVPLQDQDTLIPRGEHGRAYERIDAAADKYVIGVGRGDAHGYQPAGRIDYGVTRTSSTAKRPLRMASIAPRMASSSSEICVTRRPKPPNGAASAE